MKRSFYFLVFILLCLVSTGCAKDKEGEKLEYNGRALVIGVVGEKPKDTFRNIKFENVKLEEMQEKSAKVDGFLVMKEYFQEASKEQYTDLFLSLKKPVFFIGLKDRPYLIFTEKDLDYDNAPRDRAMMYTQGFVNMGSPEGQYWGMGLYNDTVSDQSIHNMYIIVFQTISDYLSR
ncbi:hypothetical protein COL41_28285 [Bacillus mycoides]|uniref:Lipoprotein n=1 Tax=Bacillus cereus VD021 TaxID=1053224 RepID=R8HKU1_BACCE|nr:MULTISPECIES: hypothetical protein [Bacillus cereus group]EOO73489.1 lipoprotein [Bacillus cereus VD021]MED1381307.1 hypothetical protein [Bacillus mycoides]PFX89885.1 hypothetical protein COL41_28285 [Bacillus mycoides]QEL87546.1 hypothetical protein DN409_25415 [Bacillus mycoides]QWH03286.1 hypothetical protein EXW52_25195 [Bacillus mycoides]